MRVLMIEDKEDDYHVIARKVAETGDSQIDWRSSLKSGLAYLETTPTDVLLLDLNLPDGKGLPVFNQIQSRFPHLPVVIVTAYNTDEEAAEAVRQGAEDYLPKDKITPYLLKKSLVYAIERKRYEETLRLQAQIAEHVAEGVVMARISDRILVYTNPVFERMFGYERGELPGQPVSILHAPSDRPPDEITTNIMDALVENGSWSGEIHGIRKDGSLVWCWVHASTFEHSVFGRVCVSIHEDITARKQLEVALVEERNFLQVLMDNLPDMIFFKDRASRFVHINRYHANMMGFERPEDAYGKTDFDVHDIKLAQQTFADEQHIIATGEPIIDQIEYNPAADGQPRWFSVTKVPHRDNTGRIIGIIGIARNISEHKFIEDVLREQEEFLRQIIDTNPNFVFVKDTDGRYLLVNQAFAQFNGMTVEQLVGKYEHDLPVGTEQVERSRADDLEVISTLKPKLIHQEAITNAKGQTHWFQTTKTPLAGVDGKTHRVLGVAADITERKQVEAALSGERNLLRTLIDNIPDLISVKDTQCRYIIANPPVLHLLGVTQLDDLIGKDDSDFLPPEQAQHWYEIESRLMQSGESLFNYEEAITDQSSGSTRWMLVTKVPISDERGNPSGLVTINRDITQRKMAEAQQLDLRLEREKIEFIHQFLGQVSHDFRTPLTIMKTSTYLAQKAVDPERRAEHLEKLNSQIDHIQRMLEDIFTLVQLDLKAVPFAFHPCNLNTLIHSLHTYYKPLADGKSCHFELNLASSLPTVQLDETHFTTAISHLILNAITYTPPDGSVWLETGQDGEYVTVQVRDSGIGINPEDLSRIFERFYRADKARGITTGGSGLGLPIAQKIIEEHGGKIEASSTAGEGSTFRIVLPLVTPVSAESS